MTQKIPDLITLQGRLLDWVFNAGARVGVTPIIWHYRQSPRLGLAVQTVADREILLAACAADHLQICLAATPSEPTRIWARVLARGRMLHGPPSGIDLIIAPAVQRSQALTFPCPEFGGTWLNDHLAGRTVSVSSDLLDFLAVTHLPKTVDIVITWVDGQDPAWQTRRAAYQPKSQTRDATDPARFESTDELLYTLRGLFRYFDGCGQVYLVTDGQVPAFWAEFADRVTLIDHAAIMDIDVARPTFNSHVIESCLHKIPGLSSHYLYLNDDVIVANATGVCDFFDDQGRAKLFYSDKTFVPDGPRTDDMLAADAAAVNTRDLFAQSFNYPVTRKFRHCPIAINRDVICDLEQLFAARFARLRQNRFRHPEDIAPSGSLYQHYALMTDQAIQAQITYRYLEITAAELPSALLRLGLVPAEERPTIVCLNAVTGGVGSRRNQRAMRRQMTRLLPSDSTRIQTSGMYRSVLDAILWGYRALRKIGL